ncbi:MAG: LysR family transcriptional regulator [Coprococcus sp.]
MNLMHLRYFCKLAETQHYTVAANDLYISQPGLSGAITSLEQELGVRLFEKKGRNVYLTKYGKEFYQYVKESLNILDVGIAMVYEKSGKLKGSIDIGSITTVLTNYLPTVITDFRNAYPNIKFNIFQGQTENILHMLEDSTYDIGFCSYTKPYQDMTAIPVLNQEVVAVVYKDHPLADRTSVVMSDLLYYDILTYSRSLQIGQQFYQLIQSQNFSFPEDKLHFEYQNELFLSGILVMDACISPDFLPVGLMANVPHLKEFPELVILPVDDIPPDFRTVYIVYNHRTFNTHVVNLFIDFVKKYYSLETT